MHTLPAVARPRPGDSLEDLISAYESHLASTGSSLEEFWNLRGSTQDDSTLAALIKYDLDRRFGQGERPRVVEYLDRFPTLKQTRDQVVSLVYEEFCLLRDSGEDPDSNDFFHAYAPWRDSLLSQLDYDRDFSQFAEAQARLSFPAVGERFDRYQLVKRIGEGAAAKVYLASEDELAGRLIVIKISASFGLEPTILARLKHRNIVPIYTFTRSHSGLRGICMPYRPGLTLDQVIRRIGRGSLPRHASVIGDILRHAESQAASPIDSRRPGWNGFPGDRPFPDAVAWIGLCLADALAYVHSQGVLHRDIKPANILLTHEDGPQLLDFNLAQEPEAPRHAFASINGGTLPYMAPEQLQAFLDLSAWHEVGHEADLYSLGLVLRELATGCPPELPDPSLPSRKAIQGLYLRRGRPVTRAREINPLIPPSLDSILLKCLAFEKQDRYSSASDLSHDLKRYLDRQPLEFADNSSRMERSANWLHRNRRLTCSALLSCALLCGAALFRDSGSIAERSDFRQAVVQLKSSSLIELEKSQETFLRLSRQFRNSAWPLLHLALTIEKRNEKSSKPDPAKVEEFTRLIREASEKPDAEEAFRSGFEFEPDSITLQTNYALLLLKNSEEEVATPQKAQREEQARKILNRALDSDPRSITVLNALIKLERASMHYQRTIELTTDSIKQAEKLEYPGEKIYAYYNIKISCLSKLADQSVDEGSTAFDRLQAPRFFDEMESVLEAMTVKIHQTQPGKGSANHPYLLQLYQGCIASGRGVLAADSGDLARARSLFDQAEGHFKTARQYSIENSRGVSYTAPVNLQLDLLNSRRQRAQLQKK